MQRPQSSMLATDLWSESAKFEFCFPEVLASDLTQNANILSLYKNPIQISTTTTREEHRKGRNASSKNLEPTSPMVSSISQSSLRGVLLSSIFAIPVFPLPQRDVKKLYVIALDLAKELGMRDSYTLFHRNMDLLDKLWATEQEKNWLSSLGLIASNFRHRDISLVEINQAVIKYLSNVTKPGVSAARVEQFLENPIISDILKPSEFECMKDYGLIPDGYNPNVQSIASSNDPSDANIDGHFVKRPKLVSPPPSSPLLQLFQTENHSLQANSVAFEKAVIGATAYNRKLHLYRSSTNDELI